jgi:hypothetical protein
VRKAQVVLVLAALATVLAGCGSATKPKASHVVSSTSAPQQAVMVHMRGIGTDDAFNLDQDLYREVSSSTVGEYDGRAAAADGSEVIFSAYGPDANALWVVMKPIVEEFSPRAGSYVIKRYGDASDPSAKEVRIALR